MTGQRLVFCDVETTGRKPAVHEVWEVATIERREDGSNHPTRWFIQPQHLENSEPQALRVNRYYERTQDLHLPSKDAKPGEGWTPIRTVAAKIARLSAGARLVGLNVAFDAAFLERLLRAGGCAPAWDHHMYDLWSMSAGFLGSLGTSGMPPSSQLSQACGVDPPHEDEAHTAMADARWAMEWYDTLTAPKHIVLGADGVTPGDLNAAVHAQVQAHSARRAW